MSKISHQHSSANEPSNSLPAQLKIGIGMLITGIAMFMLGIVQMVRIALNPEASWLLAVICVLASATLIGVGIFQTIDQLLAYAKVKSDIKSSNNKSDD